MTGSRRVLQVVLSLNPGGTERLVLELASRLNAEIPMMVCCLDEPGSWADDLRRRGIGVVALNRRAGFRPGLGRGVARAARAHRATIIHAHHYSPFVYSCIARLWQPAVRVVFTEHGRLSDARPSPKRRVVNQVLSKIPSGVFSVSEDLKEHLIEEGFPRRNVGVIYNGIDVGPAPDAGMRARVRAKLGLEDDAILLGTIARLDQVKDLGTLIRATAIVRSQSSRPGGCALVIIGDGAERARLESLTAELEMGPFVRFLGHRDDAREWLAGCDIFANSSISEGVSLTILEGMAAGLPVVATGVGGTPEVIDRTCGRLVASRDPDAFAAAVSELGNGQGLRQELGRAARRRVEDRFTLARMVSEYRQVYNT